MQFIDHMLQAVLHRLQEQQLSALFTSSHKRGSIQQLLQTILQRLKADKPKADMLMIMAVGNLGAACSLPVSADAKLIIVSFSISCDDLSAQAGNIQMQHQCLLFSGQLDGPYIQTSPSTAYGMLTIKAGVACIPALSHRLLWYEQTHSCL